MRASIRGRDELTARVQTALSLPTKKEAEHVVNSVIASLATALLNNLGTDGFHKPGIRRKIGFSGQTIQTKMRRTIKFVSLEALRQRGRVPDKEASG